MQPKKKFPKEEWGGIAIEHGIMEISWETEYAGNTAEENIPKPDNARKKRLLGRMRPEEKASNAPNLPKYRFNPEAGGRHGQSNLSLFSDRLGEMSWRS